MAIDHPIPSSRRAACIHRVPRRVILLPALLLLAACEDPAGEQAAAQTCTSTVQLAVGESAELPADAQGRVRCRIGAGNDAEFAVAFVDTRAIRKAETQNEGYGNAFDPYTVSVALAEDVPAAPSQQGISAALAPDFDVQLAAPPQGSPPLRETPWTVDERFSLYDGVTHAPRTARILRVYEGGFAVAWFEGDNEPTLPALLAQLDSAWQLVRDRSLPLMRTAFSDEVPRSSPGSGQYLVVLRGQGLSRGAGRTAAVYDFGVPRIWTDISAQPLDSHLRLAELLAHELGHAFQAMYMYRTRPAGVTESYAAAAFWGAEGGADLVSFETIRRAAGVPLTANFDGFAAGLSPVARRLAQWTQPGGGRLNDGYADAAGFLRRLAALRVEAGDAEDVAVAEVLRGASDGWYGYDYANARRPGLVERMRARLGASWTPDDALLDWALAHAADDRTPSPRFQDPTFLRAWQATGGAGSWQPMATLPAAGGGATTMSRTYGSPDYLLLRFSGEEPFAAAATVPGVRWRILRIR
jgi:hypothetical protein